MLRSLTSAALGVLCALGALLASPLQAAMTGPTLQFAYDAARPLDNPLGRFMYFVPLVTPEQVSAFTNTGNTQCARVISCRCHTNGLAFHAVCDFNFTGEGLQRNVFSHAVVIQRREQELKSGKTLAHQLAALSVQGAGWGTIEIDGTLTNGQPAVDEMRIRFNCHNHASPVSVDLQDIVWRDGEFHFTNDLVARVNSLSFRRMAGVPKMEVTLASVRRQDAAHGAWQRFVGRVKGEVANLLLPPLTITADGNATMLEFGLALAQQRSSFTFPFAERLTNCPAIAL